MKILIITLFLVLVVTACTSCKRSDKGKKTKKQYSIVETLNDFLDDYHSIKSISLKYLKFGGKKTNSDLSIYNQTWIAPLKYGIILFSPTPIEFIERFEKNNLIRIPPFYKQFLLNMNGCFIFDLNLFGLTPSIYLNGLLNRSEVQCFDLATANSHWIREYDIKEELFHFGNRKYSYEENIGYFLDKSGKIKSIRKNGQLVKQWSDFSQFLNDEIALVEKMMIDKLPQIEKDNL